MQYLEEVARTRTVTFEDFTTVSFANPAIDFAVAERFSESAGCVFTGIFAATGITTGVVTGTGATTIVVVVELVVDGLTFWPIVGFTRGVLTRPSFTLIVGDE